MLTPNEAFRKFRSNLELTQKEQDSASSRQKEIRALMDQSFKIADDFLTGSRYRNDKAPAVVLGDVEKVLAKKYGSANVSRQRRAVTVEFIDSADEERVMSFDVVPAFTKSDHYEIPDTGTKNGWTETNPKIHFDKAKEANDAFNGEWKGMVRMAKSWNRTKDKIVKPSFLIEVMALQVLRPPFGGDFPYEFMGFFATMADRVGEDWQEPAGLGPPVSDSMDATARAAAKTALTEAHHMVREAIQLSRTGRTGDALRKYRELFGERFPLS